MMTVEYELQPDGALLMEVVSDAFGTLDEFFNSGAAMVCVTALDQVTDKTLVKMAKEHRRNGGNFAVRLLRSDGSEVRPQRDGEIERSLVRH